MSYQHDVFISYSSLDAPWAAKLETELQARLKNVYRDQSRLVAGAKWEDELVAKVRNSQHLVIFWSRNAADSDWVRRERGLFEAAIAPVSPGNPVLDRLMIFVVLDDAKLAYTSLQIINGIKDAQAYAGGAAGVNADLWRSIVREVVNAIQTQDKSIPVPTVILAATQAEIQNLPADTVASLVSDFNLGNSQALFDRYKPVDPLDPKRADWRPYGSNDNIATILEKQQIAINQVTGSQQFRWDFIGDDFWKGPEVARRYAETLRERLSLIVVDPVSLNVDLVQRRANLLKKCLANSDTAVLAPMPFGLAPPFVTLRKLLRDTAAPLFDEYFYPQVREAAPLALIGMNIGDEEDTQRLLLATMAPYVRRLTSTSGSAYTKQ
jgi:hypothetical protein